MRNTERRIAMAERSSSGIGAIMLAAIEEAQQRGDRLLGSEHLFLGLLHEADSVAVKALGADLSGARAALEALDRAALAAIGLNVGDLPIASRSSWRKNPRMSSAARAVVNHAVKEATRTKGRHVWTTHMALALLACEPPDPVAALIAELGIDGAAVRERLNRTES
jgi:ATP-dependent Clp protease ATP-binding subunit ClpA